MLSGASNPLIPLPWVIFESSFSKHLLSEVHLELLFHVLCLYHGCGLTHMLPGGSGSFELDPNNKIVSLLII